MYDEGVCNACIAAECTVDDDSGTSGTTDDNGGSGGGGGGGEGGSGGGAKHGSGGGVIAGVLVTVLFIVFVLFMSRNPEARARAITCLQEACQAAYDACGALCSCVRSVGSRARGGRSGSSGGPVSTTVSYAELIGDGY